MTVRYECDRCHEQFDAEKELTKVTVVSDMGTFGALTTTLHYCRKCSIYFNNAISIVNDGTYDGRMKE